MYIHYAGPAAAAARGCSSTSSSSSKDLGRYAGVSRSALRLTSGSSSATFRASSHAYQRSVRVCFILACVCRIVISRFLAPSCWGTNCSRFRSLYSVASLFRSLQHMYHSECRSSQDLCRSSSTVQGRPVPITSSRVLNAFRFLLKKPQSPWFESTGIFDLFVGSSTGCGSGCFDMPFGYLRPVLRRADSPLCGLPSRFLFARTERVAVVENEDR